MGTCEMVVEYAHEGTPEVTCTRPDSGITEDGIPVCDECGLDLKRAGIGVTYYDEVPPAPGADGDGEGT